MIKMYQVGIDEAGRGSLVGPMVVSAVAMDIRTADLLSSVGVADSKQLSPQERSKLSDLIKNNVAWYGIVVVPPILIDSYNLNKLTGIVAIFLVKRACTYLRVEKVLIDMIRGIRVKRMDCQGLSVPVIVEEKADNKYVEVAAASILAKVERDKAIGEIRKKYGLQGSGYPSDPQTLEWLSNNLSNIPRDIVRRKWSTLKKLGKKPGNSL